MSMKRNFVLSLIVTSFSTASQAGDWSIGVFAGQTTFDQLDEVSCFGGAFPGNANIAGEPFCINDTDGTALGINLGYHFNRSLGLEAGYVNLDEYQANILVGGDVLVGDVSAEPEVLYAAVVSTLPLTERLSLSGRLGYYDLNAKLGLSFLDESITGSDLISDTGFYSGASLDYEFNGQISAQLRYDDFGLDALSLGLKFSF